VEAKNVIFFANVCYELMDDKYCDV